MTPLPVHKKGSKRKFSCTKTTSALPVIKANAAGIDIAAGIIYVAVPEDRSPEPVRAFGTFTCDRHAIADWLRGRATFRL